jgi:hypothetical protein
VITIEWTLVWWYGGWRTPLTERAARLAHEAARKTIERRSKGIQVCGVSGVLGAVYVLTTAQPRAEPYVPNTLLPDLDPATGEPYPFIASPYRRGHAAVQPLWADGTPRPLEENDYGYYMPRTLTKDHTLNLACAEVRTCGSVFVVMLTPL